MPSYICNQHQNLMSHEMACKAKKKNMCVYYLMKISNRVGRSIFFFIYLFNFFLI